MSARIELLGDGIAVRDDEGRKVAALRFIGEGGSVRIIREGEMPAELHVSPDDAAHFAQTGIEAAVNASWPNGRRAKPPD